MAHIGIDLEQFAADPQSSGIQRVLQQLARHWPASEASAHFVVPYRDRYLLLSPSQAEELVSTVFTNDGQGDPRGVTRAKVADLAEDSPMVDPGRLMALFDAWLLPEVSYRASVLERFRLFDAVMPSCMIGFDVLPMSEPVNYRFLPGTNGQVSEYFRLLATCDSVVCISDFTRDQIWLRLRRDRVLPISVAHPGGDHVLAQRAGEVQTSTPPSPVRFLRVGTLEARKQPVEIVRAFEEATARGMQAELVFVGSPSASDQTINATVQGAAAANIGVQWIQQASDSEVLRQLAKAHAFLSVGTEGFGIPVLEAIRVGTPVLFGGTQPAAELMQGYGAAPLIDPERSLDSWPEAFRFYADAGNIDHLRSTLDANHVPTWSTFALRVTQAVLRA